MAQDEFFESLSTALQHWTPSATGKGARRGATALAVKLDRAALWLTEDAVRGYDPADFRNLPPVERAALDAAVADFLDVARSVPPEQPANDEQYRRGKARFERIVSLLRAHLLDDWTAAVQGLVFDAKSWAEKQGWRTKAQQAEPQVEERLLGEYTVWQLQFVVDDDILALRPVSRFVVGGELTGLVELIKTLSPYTVRILRGHEGWHLRIEAGKTAKSVRRLSWNESTFLQAVAWLRSRE